MTRPHPSARFAVPAYFHPADRPEDWRALAAMGPSLGFAIMNPDSGPGAAPDPRYHPAVAAVHAAGGRVIGYVDTAYARRSGAAVLRDLTAYRDWYGLRGVFLDQITSGPEQVAHYRRIAHAARGLGFDLLVANPGTVPVPHYADIYDVVVTFEGPWDAYRDHVVTPWIREHAPTRFCHLVHGAPPGALEQVIHDAADRNAGTVYATELTGANPWSDLAGELRDAFSARPSP
jgi:Spherulation-specific family 4